MSSLQERIGWNNNSLLLAAGRNDKFDAFNFIQSFTESIKDYLLIQIKDFLKENNISEKQWLKRGVIQVLPNDISLQSYILYYKKWRKEYKRKVTINYNFVTNPEDITIKNCKRKHAIAENPHSEVSAAIPCYTHGCSNCIYKN